MYKCLTIKSEPTETVAATADIKRPATVDDSKIKVFGHEDVIVDYIFLKATFGVRTCPGAMFTHRFAANLLVLQVHARIDEQRNRIDTSKVHIRGQYSGPGRSEWVESEVDGN